MKLSLRSLIYSPTPNHELESKEYSPSRKESAAPQMAHRNFLRFYKWKNVENVRPREATPYY